MSNSTNAADGAAFIEQFAQRVATRDDPPPPDPDRFTPARIQARIEAAVGKRLGQRDPRRQRNLARLLLVLMRHRRLTTPQIATECGWHRQNVPALARLLLAARLLDDGWDGHYRWYRLSRAGEDWLLPIVRDEATG